MATLAKGKAVLGLVLPETMIDEVKHLAVERRVRPSHMAEELIRIGLKKLGPKARKPAPAASAV